jgi:putative sporulation protein YtaF
MPPVLSLLVLAFAVSLDGFGVGVMYGLRKIRMPLYAVGIISLSSGCIIYLSMQVGTLMLHFMPPSVAKTIGAFILMGIGIWAVCQIVLQRVEKEADLVPEEISAGQDADGNEKKIMHIEIKRLGLVIQILKTPSAADIDKSGNISAAEAALLGLALSLDAFGAGIGAALIGFPPVVTAAVIALASGTFIAAGLKIGFLYSDLRWIRKLSLLPGCILILMGILKLM